MKYSEWSEHLKALKEDVEVKIKTAREAQEKLSLFMKETLGFGGEGEVATLDGTIQMIAKLIEMKKEDHGN